MFLDTYRFVYIENGKVLQTNLRLFMTMKSFKDKISFCTLTTNCHFIENTTTFESDLNSITYDLLTGEDSTD